MTDIIRNAEGTINISQSDLSIRPTINYSGQGKGLIPSSRIENMKSAIIHNLNAPLLKMSKSGYRRKNSQKPYGDHAGCSSDIYQLLLHKSSLLEDLAENKYDFDHNQYRRKKE